MNAAPIAIIGMGLRLPGADDPDRYWAHIQAGTSHVRRFTTEQFAAAGVPERDHQAPGFVGASARIAGIDRFDGAFFGMSARESAITDPQHRLLLQTTYHALEDGGYARPDPSIRIGMCATTGYGLYSLHLYLLHQLADELGTDDWAQLKGVQTGNVAGFAANRAAFRLGFTGPVTNISTTCSSALVGVHLACQALRDDEADLMVVGAAALHLPQVTGHHHAKGSILSPTGAVRAFDADADGTVGGNGVVAVLLKPLDAALRDGDTVHAVVRGSAVTNDGADKRSFAAPSVSGQRAAVLGALKQADVPAETIRYLEAHGTGTFKGDPIEFDALTGAFRAHTDRVGFCALGSAKPAIGHVDHASGLAGLVKVVLALRHGVIPPLVNFRRPNPLLDIAASPFTLTATATPWPRVEGPRRAGVHAVGMGGTNAHVILEQAPPPTARAAARTAGPPLVLLSARHPEALREGARRLAAHLRTAPPDPADLLTSLAVGRPAHRHRLVVTADPADPAAVAAALDAFAGPDVRPPAVITGSAPAEGPPPTVVFLFSGQGRLTAGAARVLADRFPVVADVVAQCVAAHTAAGGAPGLAEALLGAPGPWRAGTDLAQPALFALQAAQLRMWQELGVTPTAVAGHSVGEYAALHAAGALDLADGAALLAARGRAMQGSAAGAMLAVFADRDRVAAILTVVPGVELALVNGPSHHVLAGRPEAVRLAAQRCAEAGVRVHLLPVQHAFHSALLDPVLPAVGAAAGQVRWRPVQIGFAAGLDGTVRHPGWVPDPEFLLASARRPVDFPAAVDAVLGVAGPGHTALVELGPTDVLTGLVRRARPDLTVLATQGPAHTAADTAARTGRPDALTSALAQLHCRGVALDWAALLAGTGGRRVPLPGYAFRPDRHWFGPALPPDPEPVPLPPSIPPLTDPRREDTMSVPTNAAPAAPTHPEAETSVLHRVAELTAAHLGQSPGELDLDESFVGLGADSLQLIGLLRQLEAEFDAEVALNELLEEAGTPRLVARLLAQRSRSLPPAASAPLPSAAVPLAATPAAFAGSAHDEPFPTYPAPAVSVPQARSDQSDRIPSQVGDVPVSRAEFDELVEHLAALARTQTRVLEQLSEVLSAVRAEPAAVTR